MAALGGRVTTYGKKKTQIISVHTDIVNQAQTEISLSPLPKLANTKRPVLRTKLSNDITNLPLTPLPSSRVKGKSKAIIEDSPNSSPEIIFKARKVPRPGKIIIPKSPSPSKSVRKIPEVIIHTKSNTKKGKNLDGLTSQFKKIITIEDSPEPEETPLIPEEDPQIALNELLNICSSINVSPFSDFLAQGQLPEYDTIKKVGEASYSEVFGLACENEVKHVLKVIPLLSSTLSSASAGENRVLPDCSRVQDVKREIEVTKRMSQVPGGGFVDYIGAYVVEGPYPERLLAEWDLYKGTEGSSSIRPSALPESQKYCLLVLSNAGTDLETFKFSQSTGWAQATGIFWQLVSSLSRAEQWTQFEHRDLHEGQILIQPYTCSSNDSNIAGEDIENYLNHSTSGLTVTIIDFGLSRLTLPNQIESIWTELPKEVYEGKGSQWDLYRSLKIKIESENEGKGWKGFNPITNVMWLHYILKYMISKLRQPKQPTRRSSRLNLIYQKEEKAFLLLNSIEKLLSFSVGFDNGIIKRKGLRGEIEYEKEDSLNSSQDVFRFGEKQGWIKSSL
ncbi:uncharacterized protein I206_104978 [Kwoniella pini CBS 10737]|uniref:non-specific serine/threonine protein kinase n=1 Tax=Kwoniella pini CBS 10737 TaxID=1296096 RepID=A0A1B9I8T0_9TREE|nr:HASPIN protein kinase [Kwoniella pini CBS 10737]OCF51801.1 HASPIN protein kinase [Kwoniella pini CBS 10737]